jgi:hypothetical protein
MTPLFIRLLPATRGYLTVKECQCQPVMRQPPADLRLYYLQRSVPSLEGVSNIQSYFPSLEQLFPSIMDQTTGSPTLAAKELIVDISGGIATVEDLQTKARRTVQSWTRMVHLVEPIDAMSGELVLPNDGALPSFRAPWQRALRKINDPYNEAYTDAVFACMASRLVETGRSPHFCRFYGTYNARVPEYRYNITDDMSEVEGEDWFREGLQTGAFKILAVDPYDPDLTAEMTHPWENVRQRLYVLQDNVTVSTEESASSSDQETSEEVESDDTGDLVEADIEVSGEAEVRRPQIQLSRLGGSQRSGSDSTGSEDDIEYRALLKNFPVQMTVLERCDGTMDDLMEDEIADDATEDMKETKEQRWTAWVFQVVAALTAAQQAYEFIHNDLHTNNVMWCGTGETHLYYHLSGAAGGDRFYRVPTFGRIMKIIDFGRATFRPPAAGTENRIWFPDAYAPDAVAGGQYNCGPYFDQDSPKVGPNKSFDLCRLAVAILDTLWDPENPNEVAQPRRVLTKEPGHVQAETTSPLWNLMWLWLTDKYGKNVLRAPDGSERYPQFDLYCAIARDVTNAVPAQQLTLPLFDSAFRCRRKDIPADVHIWKLQAVHSSKH